MNPHSLLSVGRILPHLIVAMALSLTACKPDGFINKVKYNGEKYVNTCESFTASVNKLIQNNNDPNKLRVAAYDNTDFTYYYLEPGQFEIKGDTLYFRLAQDLEYGHYLAKGVSVHVNAAYKAADNIRSLEADAEGKIGTLVVDQAYFLAHRKPFFLYKFPLAGKDVSGKQLMLSFAIVKYDKTGKIKQYFCETDATPIGTALPACCTAKPWEVARLQSVVEIPKLDLKEEKFVYEGFTGTIDVQFAEGSANVGDDSTFSASIIQSYVNKYNGLNYKISYLDLSGYASPGGKEDRNLKLSQQRADAVRLGLKGLSHGPDSTRITASGRGEDWERVKLMTQTTALLSASQRAEVLAICNDAELSNDAKEAKLRKLSYWKVLIDAVLVPARHTFAVMDFENQSSLPKIGRFTQRLPVASLQLEDVAKTVVSATPYQAGKDINKEITSIDDILTKTATPNLYALRASYYLAQKDYALAFADLERAGRFRGGDAGKYSQAIQSYKVLFADTLSFDARKQLYDEFGVLAKNNPGDRNLYFNRAILMDKIGYISGSLTEYKNLFEGNTPTSLQLNNRGVARMKTNRLTEAESDFQAAVSTQKNLAQSYYNLAVLSAYRGYTRKTIEYLDMAIAVDAAYKDLIFKNPAFEVMVEDPRFDKYR